MFNFSVWNRAMEELKCCYLLILPMNCWNDQKSAVIYISQNTFLSLWRCQRQYRSCSQSHRAGTQPVIPLAGILIINKKKKLLQGKCLSSHAQSDLYTLAKTPVLCGPKLTMVLGVKIRRNRIPFHLQLKLSCKCWGWIKNDYTFLLICISV